MKTITNNFITKPVNNNSIHSRKMLCGVGVNDADYIISPIVNGVQVRCPFYNRWKDMIYRCYSEVSQKGNPTYKACTVCDEWLLFSNFKKWMEKQDWKGKQIDKDIKVKGNKEYGPDTCLLVTLYDNQTAAHSGTYKVKPPNGSECLVVNMSLFCIENNLCKSSMYRLSTGKISKYKGWSAKKQNV